MINRARSRTRARGEHAFRIVKQLWGFAKVRYRGLAKNLARAQTMFALANLYQFRRELLPTELRCGLWVSAIFRAISSPQVGHSSDVLVKRQPRGNFGLLARRMGQQETAIYEVLRKAQADGTLSQTQDARALARFFLGVAWGINAVNKSVADPGVFRDMVRVAMSVWDTAAAVQIDGPRMTERRRRGDAHGSARKKVAVRRSVPHNSKQRRI